MALPFTEEERQLKYLRNEYLILPPPVNTDDWKTIDWVHYIDAHGKWIK